MAAGALAALVGCGRRKPPAVTKVWLGPSGGCVEATPTKTWKGTTGCWGSNEAGQIGDGTTEPRPLATPTSWEKGQVTELSFGERHACGVFDDRHLYCWGDGARGQLGAQSKGSPTPVPTGDPADGEQGVSVRVGGAHTCVRPGKRDTLRCFGADDEGQLGASPSAWDRGAEVRAFALGAAHTCAAFGPSKDEPSSVVCRGRKVAAPTEPLLRDVTVLALAAGAEHTCALVEDRTVRCWGKNDAGQLGDGTRSDSAVPTQVLELRGIVEIAAGARHTCARMGNDTIACWGDNARHQLADGTTESRSRPAVVVGLLGVRQIALAGDGSCALLDGGYLRCWGPNDKHQLGGGASGDHTVPMPIKFQQ